jgi:hypothetical protein
MPKSWQEIYNMKIAGYNNNEIAEFRGVTEAAIRKTFDKIKKAIKKDEKLKKIYFTGSISD